MVGGGSGAALAFVPNQDRVSPPAAAGLALTMRVSAAAGDAGTFGGLGSLYRGSDAVGLGTRGAERRMRS
jgi:hypothetical protein